MRGDWLQLGIEPTHDIALIRRAYALRLRNTRPDDDAEAYQHLRSAYDRLLAAARAAAPLPAAAPDVEDAPPAVPAPIDPVLPAPVEPEPPAEPEPAAVHFPAYGAGGMTVPVPRIVFHETIRDQSHEPPNAEDGAARRAREARASREARQRMRFEESRPSRQSRESEESGKRRQFGHSGHALRFEESRQPDSSPDSVDSLAAEWRAAKGGPGGMALAWPGIALRLDRLALATHAQASRVFADIVIATPQLPPSCMARMREHFDWSGDFRVERLLGAVRAAALNRLLDEVAPRPITDPQILHAYRHLLLLSRMLARGDYLRAALLSALVGVPMSRLAANSDPALLFRLGGDLLLAIRRMSRLGAWLRLIAWVGGLIVIGFCFGADLKDVGQGLTGAMFFIYGYFVLRISVHAVHGLLHGAQQDRLARWLVGPSLQRAGPAAGNAMVVLAAALFGLMSIDASMAPEMIFVGFALAFAGTVLAWPAARDDALLCALIGAGLAFLGWGLFGLAWCLLSAWRLQSVGPDRAIALLRGPGQESWQRRPTALAGLGALAGLVLASPLVAMVTARRMGMPIVLAALAVPAVLHQMPISLQINRWSVLIVVPVALVGLILVQIGSIRLVDAWQRGREQGDAAA